MPADTVVPTSDDSATIEKVESRWKTHYFTVDISEDTYTFRVLKMNESLLIYIGQLNAESVYELSMAIPAQNIVGTTIMGELHGCDSQEIANQFTRRLKKQVYVSCNVPLTNNNIRLLLIKRLSEEIKNVPDAFWCSFPHWK